MTEQVIARPLEEWSEEHGDVLWWRFPITEAPYVGSPNDLGQPVQIRAATFRNSAELRINVGGWPGYHTHWTPIPMPKEPSK